MKKIPGFQNQKTMSMSNTNTIVNPMNFDLSNMKFSKPEVNTLPGKNISYKRIKINYENNNDLTDLVLESPPNLLSWGLDENRDMNTNALNGYQLSINLWSRNNVSDQEKEFVECIENICNHTKQHLVDHREEIERYDLELADLKKMNPLYWKLEKGTRVPDRGPTLYAKTIFSKKENRINTVFIDETKQQRVDPMSIFKRHCFVRFALKIESIYIGHTISLQLKLTEVAFRPKDVPLRSQLCPDVPLSFDAESSKREAEYTTPTETLETRETFEEEEDVEEEYIYDDEQSEDIVKEEIEEIQEVQEIVKPKVEKVVAPKKKSTKLKK